MAFHVPDVSMATGQKMCVDCRLQYLLLLLLKLFIARPTTSLRHNKMKVKIISLEATFKTVLVGGRADMFQVRVPATENALSPNLVLILCVV